MMNSHLGSYSPDGEQTGLGTRAQVSIDHRLVYQNWQNLDIRRHDLLDVERVFILISK